MTLLAHWKLDEGSDGTPTVAVDSAGGGSGFHHGTYNMTDYYGRFCPGGVGGHHIRVIANANGGQVVSIANPADLRLLGKITVMFWFHRDDYYYTETRKIINCSGINDADAAQNDLWDVRVIYKTVQVRWETAPGTRVTVTSIDILPPHGWNHIAVVRYEVSAGMWGIKFYVNGVLADTQNNSGSGWSPPADGGSSLPMIGRDGAANDNNECFIDSVRVYNSEESDANILGVYTAEEPYVLLDSGDAIDEQIENLENQIQYSKVETGPNSSRLRAGFNILT